MIAKLLDHRLVLVIPFRSADARGGTPTVVGEREELYLTPESLPELYDQRVELNTGDVRGPGGAAIVRATLVPSGRGTLGGVDAKVRATGALAFVLRLPGNPDFDDLLCAADTWRLQRPLWPGQVLPGWTSGGRAVPHLGALVDELVEGERAFSDPRALVFTYAAFDSEPGEHARYRAVFGDPPDMPPPPEDELRAALRRFAFRRWDATGLTWAFCAHGGAAVWGPPRSAEAAPAWLGPLFESVYLDMALWVALVAAERKHFSVPRLHHLRFSDQDQGRAMARAWLAAIEEDQRDLARKGWVAG